MAITESHQRLLDQIMPWWEGRGWRRETLLAKSEYQLLGIRNSMYKDIAKRINEPIVVSAQRRTAVPKEVFNLFEGMQENTKSIAPAMKSKRRDIRQNGNRQIILLDEEDL